MVTNMQPVSINLYISESAETRNKEDGSGGRLGRESRQDLSLNIPAKDVSAGAPPSPGTNLGKLLLTVGVFVDSPVI